MKDRATPSSGARDVRALALEALLEAAERRVYVDALVDRRAGALDARDRRLLQELACGTVRHQNTLDHLLEPFLRTPLSRQRAVIAWALRLGTFQIAYLSRVPSHAALDRTLEALKSAGGGRRKDVGFVNAVLRRFLATVEAHIAEPPVEKPDHALPVRDGYCLFRRAVLPARDVGGGVARLSLACSLPRWLVARWVSRHGLEEATHLAAAQNRPPSLTARVTARAPAVADVIAALAAESIDAVPGSFEGSLRLKPRSPLDRSEVLRQGWLQVQDETAMRIGAVLSPPAGARVLDLCAAPGGKAVQLLERVGSGGRLLATDRSEKKLRILQENLARTGLPFEVRGVPRDPDAIDLGEDFSHVLLDAPCSNTGVLARRAEARWRIRARVLETLAAQQGRLLEAAWRHLRPGGRLLYATCSIEPEENEDVIAAFSSRHAEAVELETALFLPHRSGADGGFYSLLLRPSAAPAVGRPRAP